MRRLIIDVYRAIYYVTGAKGLSLGVAIVYVSALNMIVLYGLGLLLEGWLPTSIVHKLFAFPYYFVTGAAMLGGMIWIRPPMKNITKEAKKATDYTFIIVYTVAAVFAFLYIKYADKIF